MTREFPELASGIKSFYNAVERNSDIAAKWLRNHPDIAPRSPRDYIDFIKLIPQLLRCKLDNANLGRMMSLNASFKKVMEAQKVLLSFRTNNQSPFSLIFNMVRLCAALIVFHRANRRFLILC